MDYRPAVDLAIQRHQGFVLLAVEMAGRRFPKFSENYMKFLDGQLREINFQIAISSVKHHMRVVRQRVPY
ncbi:hypothetical protein T03_11996 [Trichinella britovi]|uniref:Uncharacterized protein n=1 Tax=Trichinella britovi TaxID=45882 RepID=A0A0V0ZQU3_TRIBR|nr:hypothetical protein T03_11996 [Trichinella britovi]